MVDGSAPCPFARVPATKRPGIDYAHPPARSAVGRCCEAEGRSARARRL